ncbi:hypothetical protein AgCh_032270 [Apium graveolens]
MASQTKGLAIDTRFKPLENEIKTVIRKVHNGEKVGDLKPTESMQIYVSEYNRSSAFTTAKFGFAMRITRRKDRKMLPSQSEFSTDEINWSKG